MSRKLYLHRKGQDETELIEVEESITVEELVTRHGEVGHSAWAQDGEELIVTDLVIEVIEERGHVHVGPQREVEVTVRFGGVDKTKEYKPGTRVLTVLHWAEGQHGFNVPESQRSDLGLFLRDSEEPLDKGELIGVLDTEHRLHLNMQSVKRHNG
jgi:hypothetical protein